MELLTGMTLILRGIRTIDFQNTTTVIQVSTSENQDWPSGLLEVLRSRIRVRVRVRMAFQQV